MFNEKNLPKLMVIIPILFILTAIFFSMYISVSLLNSHFNYDQKLVEEKELQLQKQYIKSQVDSIFNYIDYKREESSTRLKTRLKNRVYTGHELANKIYLENKDKISEKQLQKLILETLRKVRFGVNGYYFIAHIKSDKEIITKMLPATPNAENVNAYKLKDENNNYYVQKFAQIVKENKNNEGYVEYKWFKLSKKKQFEKISFVKLFEPYNWFIGYGEYYDDFDKQIKKEALERFNQFRYGNNGYIWTMDSKYILVQHPFIKSLVGKDNKDLKDKKGKLFVRELLSTALQSKEGGYVKYYWTKPNMKQSQKKISYVRYDSTWGWVISAGVYVEDIKFSVENLIKEKESEVNTIVFKSIILSIIILIFVSIISLFVSRRVNSVFLNYKKEIDIHQKELEDINDSLEEKVEEKTKELIDLNEHLEEKISQRIKEINEKDKVLSEQSKMAALGEMMGNIAHQWRQPLSSISTAASGMKMKKELGLLEDQEIISLSDGIVKNTMYLSQVIEDFKNYVKGEKESVVFDLNDAINNSLTIFDSSIQSNNLTIIKELDDEIIIKNYKNELVQAVLNVLNNAKDALLENCKNEDDRFIFITTKKSEDKAILIIRDSAGGIPNNIINKIFEPYFTTKGKEQGTGLGLYMTYQIIIESMKGEIKVENDSFEINNKTYNGAKFIISFDLNK